MKAFQLDSFDHDRSLWLDIKIHLIPYLYLLVLDAHPRGSIKISVVMTIGFMLIWWSYIENNVYWNRGDGVTSYPYGVLNNKTFLERFAWVSCLTALSCLNYIMIGIRNKF
ncbi:hypothetical protein JA1_004708 [Spathaspora sp. JA1]|nr:hypothetical protein JA1_004708 [Spathaspora sp. JA1]